MIERMMQAERRDFLDSNPYNKGNGRVLECHIPRDRFGNFHQTILALLRDREIECEQLARNHYYKGLIQSQVGDLSGEDYGKYYSKASISHMIEYLRVDVEI